MFSNFPVPSAIQTILVGMFFSFLVGMGLKALRLGFDYVAAKVPANKLALLKSKALTIVKALEQAPQFANYENSDKKEYAIGYLLNQAEKLGFEILQEGVVAAAKYAGLSITNADIDAIIEEAVVDLKAGLVPMLTAEASAE